jgi:tetratricopeptide (TPR) repeat protein
MKSSLNEIYNNAFNLYNQQNYKEAILLYQEILSQNSSYEIGMPYWHLGNCYHELKRYDKAEECYNYALEIWPENSLYLGNLLDTLITKKEDKKAVDVYERYYKSIQREFGNNSPMEREVSKSKALFIKNSIHT